MQGDPNYCDMTCKPALQAGITLGTISFTGASGSYTPVTGNLVCKSFIDSVQNFFDGSSWDWTYFDAPFDNDSTMGLKFNTRTMGALDTPGLTNVTLEILEITERNGSDVPNWRFGEYYEWTSVPVTRSWDRTYSVDYAYTGGDRRLGCGQDPVWLRLHSDVRWRGLDRRTGVVRLQHFFDSVYNWMGLARRDFAEYERW